MFHKKIEWNHIPAAIKMLQAKKIHISGECGLAVLSCRKIPTVNQRLTMAILSTMPG